MTLPNVKYWFISMYHFAFSVFYKSMRAGMMFGLVCALCALLTHWIQRARKQGKDMTQILNTTTCLLLAGAGKVACMSHIFSKTHSINREKLGGE